MTKERGVEGFKRYLPDRGEPINEDGISGLRRSVTGIKRTGSFSGEYSLQQVVLEHPDGAQERYELHLDRAFNAKRYSVIFNDGEIASLEGFGDEHTEQERHMYAGTLAHNFAKSDEFIPSLDNE